MLLRRLLVLMVALAVAGVTALYARRWIESRDRLEPPQAVAQPDPLPTTAVLVAARPLAVGRFVSAEDLRWQPWPPEAVLDSFIEQGEMEPDSFVGAVVRRPLAAGQPIDPEALVRPEERGFLAVVLEPGMRAVTIPVDEVAGHAGLLFPGDRVDVILTQSFEAEEGEVARAAGETILSDVRVIAVGQRLQPISAGDVDIEAGTRRTATLEVTPEGARRLALARQLGDLTLALRPLRAGGDEDRRLLTWDSELSRARAGGRSIRVYRGGERDASATAPTVAPQVGE